MPPGDDCGQAWQAVAGPGCAQPGDVGRAADGRDEDVGSGGVIEFGCVPAGADPDFPVDPADRHRRVGPEPGAAQLG